MNALTLSPRRVGILMRHDLAINLKSTLTGFATVAGVVVALFLISAATGGDGSGDFHASLFANILLIGGFVVSSVAFSDLNDPKNGIHYLMLPGSTVEKYLAKLLLTSVGWTVAVTVIYTVASALGAAIASIAFAQHPGVFVPADRSAWNTIAGYLVTQSIFLFGSVYFRKVAFLKVVLGAIGVAFSLGLIYLLAARVIFADAFVGLLSVQAEEWEQMVRVTSPNADAFFRTLGVIGDVFTWAVMPIFFWIAGFMRLRETEV